MMDGTCSSDNAGITMSIINKNCHPGQKLEIKGKENYMQDTVLITVL